MTKVADKYVAIVVDHHSRLLYSRENGSTLSGSACTYVCEAAMSDPLRM
jgi:hypothetical protein